MHIYKRLAQGAFALGIVALIIARLASFTPVETALLELSFLAAAIPYGLSTELFLIRKRTAINPAARVPQFLATDILVGREHYSPQEFARSKNLGLPQKVLRLLLASDLQKLKLYESTLRMHGGQHISYLYGPAATVLAGADELWDHEHIRKLTAADRKRYAAFTAAIAYRLHGEAKTTLLGLAQITDVTHESRTNYVKQQKQIARHALTRAVRVNLASCAALLGLVFLSLLGLALYHVPPAITVLQIISISGLLVGPIADLAHDDPAHILSKARPHTPLVFGAITAVVAYGNYLFYFFRASLSPAYLETSLPQYQQATTVTLATVLLCSFAYILLERADSYERFFDYHLGGNYRLLASFGVSLVALGLIIYTPPLQWLFTTQPLGLTDWCSVILATGVYVLVRLLQRHTRKHTRSSVLKLHREIHG